MSCFLKRSRILAPALISMLLTLAGCSFLRVKEESKFIYNSSILAGSVTSTFLSDTTPVVVAAYSKNGNRRTIVHYTVLKGPGPYELIVPRGDYYIAAFGDKNRNLVYDEDEPAGQYFGPEGLSAPPGGVVKELDIGINIPEEVKIDLPAGYRVATRRSASLHYTSPGVIADLDDPIFSDEYASKGYWSPVDFFKEVGGNIYFLERYDPRKTPILFIHGACGSPRGWRYLFDNIDRDRYQPWFFYYPSGAPIEAMSYLLFWKLFNLQTRYQFNSLYIISHSMGGLVARSFLINFARSLPLKYTLISISTPWGGDRLADMGVKYSPAVVPVWKDMRASGRFIQALYQKKLPDEVDHYLFFSFRGNRNPFRPNNDDVVTLASQLDLRAQAEAKMVYGFDEDHASILLCKGVIAQLNAILALRHEDSENQAVESGAMLRVNFSYDYPDELPKPQPILLLRPAETGRTATVVYLKTDWGGQEIGPLPPGKYQAILVANAFVPDPPTIPVIIRKDAHPTVHFLLKPRGCLMGYIVDNKKTLPAGAFREPADKIRIKTINLRGAGTNRTLVPVKGTIDYLDQYLSGADFLADASFCFYNLPEGDYTLSITAEGYLPYSADYTIKPGRNYTSNSIALRHK